MGGFLSSNKKRFCISEEEHCEKIRNGYSWEYDFEKGKFKCTQVEDLFGRGSDSLIVGSPHYNRGGRRRKTKKRSRTKKQSRTRKIKQKSRTKQRSIRRT